MSYAMLTVASFLLGIDFSLQKLYQKIFGTKPNAVLLFNSLTGLFGAIVFFFINGFRLNFSLFSCIMAVAFSALCMCYSIIGFQLLKYGTMAMYTLFLMSGGMLLPYAWGIVFLNEPVSPVRIAAAAVIIAGVILSNFSREKVDLRIILMCCAVFILNGCVSIVSKAHQITENNSAVNSAEFVILSSAAKFIIAGIMFLYYSRQDTSKTKSVISPKAFLIMPCSAAISGISFFLQLLGASKLPASVLYPFITGGSIIFSFLFGIIFFKEKLSLRIVISIILCFAGTLMFL